MRNITRFRWTVDVVEHIEKHRVAPLEVEEVTFGGQTFVRTGRENTHYVLGITRAGRYLFVVVRTTRRRGEAIIITARDITEKERKYYKRRGK